MTSDLDCDLGPGTVYVNGDLRINFRRTIRVPDNENMSHLPPDLGPFPLEKVFWYSTELPDDVVVKGGLFFPMHQRGAMWIKFSSLGRYVIKIYVGGVNAISGASADSELQTGAQDYVVVPEQLWLDGIAREDGTVQQFIVMPAGSGYSVETQVTRREAKGGIQIEITPEKEDLTRFVLLTTLTGKMLGVPIRPDGTVGQLKKLIEDQKGIPDYQQRLIHAGRELQDHKTLNECNIQTPLYNLFCGSGAVDMIQHHQEHHDCDLQIGRSQRTCNPQAIYYGHCCRR